MTFTERNMLLSLIHIWTVLYYAGALYPEVAIKALAVAGANKGRRFSRIFVIACGSSYHVGIVSKYNWERLLRRPVEVCLASEFRYSDPLVDENTLVIVISQSGETLDTMAAMREAKRRKRYIRSHQHMTCCLPHW